MASPFLRLTVTQLPFFIIACFNDVLCLLILNICLYFYKFVFNETIDFHWLMFKFKVFPISRSLLRGMGTLFKFVYWTERVAMYIIGLFGLFYTTVTCYTCSPYLLCMFSLFCSMSERLYRMEIRDFKHAVMSYVYII